LANGLWLGAVPPQLQGLSFAEQLLISRVRRNRCIVKVSSGMSKMKANVIMFENPMPKIYRRLPPPVEDLDEVLAFIYTGPCKPTPAVDAVTLVTKCTAKERGPSADNAVFYKGSSELKCKNCKVLNFTRCCTNCTSYSLKC
jgi:hypothetical protein